MRVLRAVMSPIVSHYHRMNPYGYLEALLIVIPVNEVSWSVLGRVDTPVLTNNVSADEVMA